MQLIARSLLAEMSASEGQDKHFTPDALARLLEHAWLGNVRELRNVVQRVWVMTPGNVVDEEWLPVATAPRPETPPRQASPPANAWEVEAPPPPVPDASRDAADAPDVIAVANGRLCIPLGTRLSDIERQVILATFAHCERHKERTAATLGISMKTLYNRLKDYGA